MSPTQAAAISDVTMRSLQVALNGLTARRQAHQTNIANLETPGYLATKVSFESSLADALRAGTPESAEQSITKSQAPTNMSGNNVQPDEEFVGLTETSLMGQLVTEALNSKYRLIRTAITGQ